MIPVRAGGAAESVPGLLGDLLRRAAALLAAARIREPRLEAEVLAASLLGRSRASLLSGDRDPAPPGFAEGLEGLARRRAAGEPLQYLTGVQEFWSLPFHVDRRVLIPRRETEGVVEECLRRAPSGGGVFVDVGTGCGCIAVALARERPAARIVAIDRSGLALAVAAANAARLVPESRIRFVAGDLLAPLGPRLRADLVASNPPYVAEGEVPALPRDVLHEPREALVAGATGLEAAERLIAAASPHLRPGGSLVLEIGIGHWPRVRERFRADPRWEEPEVRADFQGIPRVAAARRRAGTGE
jgi:release factor glutamine methyltransferase